MPIDTLNRVRLTVDNVEEAAELVRELFHESDFFHFRHNRTDGGPVEVSNGITLDLDKPGGGVEIHEKKEQGEIWVAAISLYFKSTTPQPIGKAYILGISSANPTPATYGKDVDRNPLFTFLDDLLIIQCENILHEVITDVFYRVKENEFTFSLPSEA